MACTQHFMYLSINVAQQCHLAECQNYLLFHDYYLNLDHTDYDIVTVLGDHKLPPYKVQLR